jgi:hypothetical protein
MEPLIAAAALLTIALLAVLAPILGVDSRRDEVTWPDAPLSGRETRSVLRGRRRSDADQRRAA